MTSIFIGNKTAVRKDSARTVLRSLSVPAALILIFILLITLSVPEGCIFGSHVDWLSQHAALAETIRNACLAQGTILPSWLELGGGSNGYMFSYYGFLRPDILIGCLLPQVPMIRILTACMLAIYLASVLLCYCFLRTEDIAVPFAFGGSVLFMTAGCMFHMHRQVMFVSYMPFLLLAFLCIRRKRLRWLPLCLCLIWLHSFYYIIGVLAAVGWYWLSVEGRDFRRKYFLKGFVSSTVLSAGMAAALLIPTGLVILEHRRSGSSPFLLELFGPNVAFNNLLFNEYGMGLSFICFYAILAGLGRKKFRRWSILFLLLGLFGIFSYLLNGTLYARPKILIPFMPLVILHCARYFQEAWHRVQISREERLPAGQAGSEENPFPRCPFAVMIPVGLLWFSQAQFPMILLELFLLLCLCILLRHGRFLKTRPVFRRLPGIVPGALSLLLALTAPVGLYLTTAQTEEWVSASEISAGLTKEEAQAPDLDTRYRFDSLISPLESSNELIRTGQPRSSMYSSITNWDYSGLYYDTLMTPIRINNRVAILTSDNPFMSTLMGVRYLETAKDNIPAGYEILFESGNTVVAENKQVLPIVYFTGDTISQEEYDTLGPYEKLDALTRYTIVDGAGSSTPFCSTMESWEPDLKLSDLPEGLSVEKTSAGYEIHAEQNCTVTAEIRNPVPGKIVLLEFQVDSLTSRSVVIDINGIRNKLSNRFAPYPNGNNCFHYQFSPKDGGSVTRLEISLPKGRYILSGFTWHLYDQKFLQEKSYTPLESSGKTGSEISGKNIWSRTVQSGTIHAETDGYLATSIPLQNGLEILVDSEPSDLISVNEAFAGTFVEAGTHTVEIRFTPPGKAAGCILSILSVCGYVLFLILPGLRQLLAENICPNACIAAGKKDSSKSHTERRIPMKLKKELVTYILSGGITTGVNYVLYAALLSAHIPYLTANSIAWTGAVVTAYVLNRMWVFRSGNHVLHELISFAGLRLLTLAAENFLLWLLISRLKFLPFPAKLLVSVVTVAGNYVLCKYGVFKKSADKKEEICHG